MTSASTARMTMTTTAPLNIGSGSLNGIAAQVSLPSMSISRLLHRWAPGRGSARLVGTRGRLVDDALEQVGLDRAIGHRWHGFARLGQCAIDGGIERRAGAARFFHPRIEIARRHRFGHKPHARKARSEEHTSELQSPV